MKRVYILSFVVSLVFVSCSVETVDVMEEEDAILKVLLEEGKAFIANDMDRLSAIHIQDSTQTRLEQGAEYYMVFSGWDDVEELYESYLESRSTDTIEMDRKNLKEIIEMKVIGNCAWVICDNIWEIKSDAEEGKWSNLQIAFLEKIDGAWKFSFNAFVQRPVVDSKE